MPCGPPGAKAKEKPCLEGNLNGCWIGKGAVRAYKVVPVMTFTETWIGTFSTQGKPSHTESILYFGWEKI